MSAVDRDARRGIVLFAHGARDPRWAEPFERLRALVASRMPGVDVRLAFLEMMQPCLDDAADALVAGGCASLSIVPVFLGQGSHVRRDLPQLADALRRRLSTIPIVVAEAVGEDEAVLAAIADFCARAVDAPPP
jgi:sirohydrochlorin cobaltochelatase